MFTLIDYIKYYKDTSLEDVKWNIIDNTLCALLSYADINSFKKPKSLKTFINQVLDKKDSNNKHVFYNKICEILELVKESKRYKTMLLSNFINIRDVNTQFGAVTITIGKIKVISYKGTDGSVIGWIENFRLAYTYPTYTQELAIKYINDNIGVFDKEVYVVGHSKGGNLAMTAAMEAKKFSKIKGVLNLDGPGFRKSEYNSDKYKKMSLKLTNIVPRYSSIGMLMYNKKYNVVDTKVNPVYEHYPVFWNVFGSNFIDSKLSRVSEELHLITINIDIEEERIRNVLESSFEMYKNKYDSRFSVNDMLKLLNDVRQKDMDIYKYLYKVSSKVMKMSKKSSKNNK